MLLFVLLGLNLKGLLVVKSAVLVVLEDGLDVLLELGLVELARLLEVVVDREAHAAEVDGGLGRGLAQTLAVDCRRDEERVLSYRDAREQNGKTDYGVRS